MILKINGKRVCSYMDIDFLLSRDKDGKVDLMVRRADKKVTLPAVQFPMESYEEGGSPIAYADFAPVFFSRLQEDTARAGTPKAGVIARDTLGKSISVGRMVWLSLLDMVTGKFKLQDISGPIGVVSILSDGAQQVQSEASGGDRVRTLESLLWLLTLFSMISINIGFMNLLPLPALDGGRLFFCLVEMIFRKPIPKRFEAWVHGVGIVLLMLFMAVISFSDIRELATGKR